MKLRNLLLMLLLLAGGAWAADKDVVVAKAWVNETAPGQDKASVQMEVTCVTANCKLTGVKSPLAASGDMQRIRPNHGRMAVESITAVPLRHGHTMQFGPQTISLVLLGLKQPLAAGDKVPVTLTLIMGGKEMEVEVKATVRARVTENKPADGVAQSQPVATPGQPAATQGQSAVMPAKP
jgi:copper(I)-binding protein